MASCLGKLFNSVINNKVVEYMERNSKLNDLHGAYMKYRSTVNKYITSQKRKLYCCFVDFREALDVPSDYLLLKLLRLCIEGKVYNVIRESCLSRIKLRNERRILKSFSI